MKRSFLFIPFVLALLFGCNLPPPHTATPVTTPRATATILGCAYMWATQHLPDLSAQVQDAMREGVQPEAEVRAEAYGEDCVAEDGSRAGFSAMQTDYHITLTVTDLSDTTILGSLAKAAIETLAAFPAGSTPGPNPGYIGIRYVAEGQELNLWFTRAEGEKLVAQGLEGDQLFDALQNK